MQICFYFACRDAALLCFDSTQLQQAPSINYFACIMKCRKKVSSRMCVQFGRLKIVQEQHAFGFEILSRVAIAIVVERKQKDDRRNLKNKAQAYSFCSIVRWT